MPEGIDGVQCSRCGTYVPDHEPVYYTVRGHWICEDCRVRYHYRPCVRCDYMTTSTRDVTPVMWGEQRVVCRDCSQYYHVCLASCGYWVDDDTGDYCDDCRPVHDCGCESGCDCGDCEDCGGGDCDVEAWNYRPYWRYYGTGPLYLGVELETEVRGSHSVRSAVRAAYDSLGSVGFIKDDGSLIRGFEIVTHPMDHAYLSDGWPWAMLPDLRDAGCVAAETAGMHIHLSRAGFADPAHVYRWLKLLYRNSAGVARVARRDSGQWAPWRSVDRRVQKLQAKGSHISWSRYAAVNVTNADTYELRVFASSLEQSEVRAAMDLADASVRYARDLTVPEIRAGGWEWPAFMEWTSDHPEYAALYALGKGA